MQSLSHVHADSGLSTLCCSAGTRGLGMGRGSTKPNNTWRLDTPADQRASALTSLWLVNAEQTATVCFKCSSIQGGHVTSGCGRLNCCVGSYWFRANIKCDRKLDLHFCPAPKQVVVDARESALSMGLPGDSFANR